MHRDTRSNRSRGFTLIELIAVIVVLAILAGVALPKYFDYAAQARESATKGTLGGMRAAVASYYANQAFNGTPSYPSYAQFTAIGTVLQESLPENPYNDSALVRDVIGDGDTPWSATPGAAQNVVGTTEGWAYDSTAGKVWANSAVAGENTW